MASVDNSRLDLSTLRGVATSDWVALPAGSGGVASATSHVRSGSPDAPGPVALPLALTIDAAGNRLGRAVTAAQSLGLAAGDYWYEVLTFDGAGQCTGRPAWGYWTHRPTGLADGLGVLPTQPDAVASLALALAGLADAQLAALQSRVATPPYALPPATALALGGVKVGANVFVTADGTISVAAMPDPAALNTALIAALTPAQLAALALALAPYLAPPYAPALRFNDRRNSMYAGSLN